MSKISESSNISKVVTIVELKSRAELNGERGVVLEYLPNGRLKVSLSGAATIISVSPDNVIFEAIEEIVDTQATCPSRALNSNLRVWPNKTFFYPCKWTIEP